MSASDNSTRSGGIGVVGALGILFVGLKLGGVIDWSWWWVTLPFWGGFALFFGIVVFVLLFAGVAKLGGSAVKFRVTRRRRS